MNITGPLRPHNAKSTAILACIMALLFGATAAQAHLTLIRQGAESAQFPEAGDQFGGAVVAGDFNGDGEDDLATGSSMESALGANLSGNVIISFGSTHGLTHVGAQLLGTTDFGISVQSSQRFGYALAAADLNNDGYDDLIVGSPGQTMNGQIDVGRIYIYAGSSGGPVPWVTYIQEDLDGFSAVRDYFGAAIVTGRFDGDIHEDVAIGSPARGTREGTVFVIYGTESGPFGDTQILTGEILGATLDTQDHFGYSLAAANVIGDVHQDLIVGAPHRDAFGEDSAGVVFLVRGSSGGLLTADNQRVTADIFDSVAAHADFGTSLATIPLGVFHQIAIGEPDRYIGSAARAGRVVLVNGGPDGAVASSARILTQETFGGTSEDFDTFGLTLASGRFESDSFTDLAIGTPAKDWLAAGSGIVHIALGGVAGIGNSGYYVYSQSALGETPEAGDGFGSSLAFGEFDFSDNGTLIVGAPGEDSVTGMVHVIAPWRQLPFPAFKTAFVRDCQGDIVYSHKPFEQVYIASTTKIMTVLLACEASQLPPSDPRHVALSDTYTVPDWVADDIPGSQAGLEEGEICTLEDLMYFSLLISGNDSAHAIGDLLYGSGGPNESLPLFITKMNDRANELGMTNTSFNNANGFEQEVVGPDFGDHYSTAYDMEILSRAAMQNPLFREISTAASKTILRNRPSGMASQTITSFQSWILNNNMGVVGSGLKGGFTPAAQTTWCVSLEGSAAQRAIATTFGTVGGGTASAQAITLAALGVSDCATWQPYEEPTFSYIHDGIVPSLLDDQIYSMNPTTPLSMQIDLFQANAEVDGTDALVRVHRVSEMGLDSQEAVAFGISPWQGTGELFITNMTDRITKIRFISPGSTRFYDIGPYGTIHIPGLEAPSSGLAWSIESHDGGPGPLHLAVQESYSFDVVAPGGIGTTSPVFTATLVRDPLTSNNDQLSVEIDWHAAGGEYVLAVHPPEVTVSAPDGSFPVGSATTLLALAPAAPNPFTDLTQIRFALRQPASVGISIHDVNGRRVRHYPASEYAAGAWTIEWDGSADRGEYVSPGIYFYRVGVNGQEAGGGKLSRLR